MRIYGRVALVAASMPGLGPALFPAVVYPDTQGLKGQVLGGGAPCAESTVTLWAASADAPKKLAETKTNDDGRFEIGSKGAHGDAILYLVATGGKPKANKAGGDNPAIALLAVLGSKPPDRVVVNEFTTVASVWTNAQFLDGTPIGRARNTLVAGCMGAHRPDQKRAKDSNDAVGRAGGTGVLGGRESAPTRNPTDLAN